MTTSAGPSQVRRRVEMVMGTAFSFHVVAGETGPSGPEVELLLDEACRLLHRDDAMFSPWRHDRG